jgi:hypothetical protein
MGLERQRDLSRLSWEQGRIVLAEWMREVQEELATRPRVERKTVRLMTGNPVVISVARRPTDVVITRAVDTSGVQWAVEPLPEWRPDPSGVRVLGVGGLPAATLFDVSFLFLATEAA